LDSKREEAVLAAMINLDKYSVPLCPNEVDKTKNLHKVGSLELAKNMFA